MRTIGQHCARLLPRPRLNMLSSCNYPLAGTPYTDHSQHSDYFDHHHHFFEDAVEAFPEFAVVLERMMERKSRNLQADSAALTDYSERSLTELLDVVCVELDNIPERFKRIRSLAMAALRSIYAKAKEAAVEHAPELNLFDASVGVMFGEIVRYDPDEGSDGQWDAFRVIYVDLRAKITNILELHDREKSRRSSVSTRPRRSARRLS